ncbi:MAG: hypothetical protein HC904_04370 [Blastochloris sp.]|nr:hypothetical protein [Blastochloris sp.]
MPQCSDLFGVKGLSALRTAKLGEQDRQLLDDELALHDLCNRHPEHPLDVIRMEEA